MVNEVDRWFARAAGGHDGVVSLYASLLTGRIFAYVRYRLRFPLLVSTFRFAVHVAEFFILLSALGGVATFTVMVLRAGSLIVAGGWWGLLEIMRDRLRIFVRTGERDAAEFEIGRWLTLGAIAAVALAIAGGVALLKWSEPGSSPVGSVYAFLVIVELALGLPIQVLHAGIYATRRVYKPIWSMFIPTGIQLTVLGAGFLYYPAAAVVIAIVASNAVSIWITVRYCVEAYRMSGISPRFGTGLRHRLPSIPPLLGFETAFSGLSLRLDAILVLALVGFYGTNTRTFDLTAASLSWASIDAFQFFYLILPLFRGTYESAGIFYFDFVRLRGAPGIRALAQRFFYTVLWTAPVVALFYWALAAFLGRVVLHDVPVTFLLALLPMFLARSLIGIYQIRLFAEGRFGAHIATLGLLAFLLWLVWIKPNPASDLVEITAAMLIQLIVLINLQHWQDRRDPTRPTLLSFGEWRQALDSESGPIAVGSASIPDTITTRQRSAAVKLISETLDTSGHFAFRSSTGVVFYERVRGDGTPVTHVALQTVSGGTVGRIGRWSVPQAEPLPSRALTERFRELFDDGIVFDTETLEGKTGMRRLEQDVLARLIPTALASLEDGEDVVAVEGYRFTPVYRHGTLRRLYVLPTECDPECLRQWRRAIKAGCTADD